MTGEGGSGGWSQPSWGHAVAIQAGPTEDCRMPAHVALVERTASASPARCCCNAACREYNTLSCTAGGKQLVLQGGHSRLHEGMGRETAVLSLDSLSWESPESAQQTIPLLGHSSSVVGRNKLLVFGGSHGDEATSAVQQLSTDSMKWLAISPSSAAVPQARMCHAAAALGDKVRRPGR